MIALAACHGGDVAAHLGGIHAGLLVMLHPLHAAADAALIDLIAVDDLLSGGGEAGSDIPRHDGAHGDAEGPQLVGQGHGIGVDGGLSGAVIRLEGDGHWGGHTADVDDAAPSLLPQDGDHAAVHPHHAEKQGVEQPLGLLGVGELDGAGDTEARVVHHQVDAALRRHHLIHGGAQRLLPGDVRHDVGDVRHAFRPAAQLIDGPAALPQGQRRGAADPGGASGDDSDFFIHGASPSRPQ